MTAHTTRLTCDAPRQAASDGFVARLAHALAQAHREAYVSHSESDRMLLADLHAPQLPPSSQELHDAWRLWFGGNPVDKL
jgi:hypothetical protein